jgi:hypothetical protein
MSSAIHVIEPKVSIHPDTVGVYAHMINGNLRNSGDRLQEIANQVGFTILAADLLEQNSKRIFDLKARDALRPGPNFIDTAKRQAEHLLPHVNNYDKRIGMGHSLGVVIVAGMQRYGEIKPFNCVELVDGFNLKAPQSTFRGYAWYLSYLLSDERHKLSLAGSDTQKEKLPAYNWSPQIAEDNDTTSAITKMRNFSELMRGTESRDGTLALAADVTLPLHITGFKNGMSGTTRELRDFQAVALDHRFDIFETLDPKIRPKRTAPFQFSIVEGWHSDLTVASKVAHNLQQTHQLFDYISRPLSAN